MEAEKTYRVEIFPSAIKDMNEIVDYINTFSPESAIKQYIELKEKIASLSLMPERCPHARFFDLFSKSYRVLIVKKYLVFFVIVDDTVHTKHR